MPSQKPSAAQAPSAARPRQPPIGARKRTLRPAGGRDGRRRGGPGGVDLGGVGEDGGEERGPRSRLLGAGGGEEGLERGLVGVRRAGSWNDPPGA